MEVLKELAIFNRVTFIEKEHSYLIDNKPSNNLSVTRLIKQFKTTFDKEAAALRVAKRTNTTVKQVLADWELNNLCSTTMGSMLHKYIENFYSNKRVEFEGPFKGLGLYEKQKIISNLPTLIQYFQNFYNDHKHLLCIKNELVIGDINDTRVCGMSDLLCYNTQTNEIEILDFKTNKKMEAKKPYGNLLFPFEDMSAGEVNEYTIQLNIYKYIIEKNTNLKIGKMKLVWFNVCNSNYVVIELEDIQSKIKKMFLEVKRNFLFLEQ